MKTNIPPTTEISLTLTLEEWFAIMAVLSKMPHLKCMFEGILSERGAKAYHRGGDRIVKQLTDWQQS